MNSPKRGQLKWLWMAILVIAIDLLTKYLAHIYLNYGQPLYVLPFFNLTLLHNYGAAFSFLSNQETLWQVIVLSAIAIAVAVGIIIWLWRLPKDKNVFAFSLSLILGGALGNVYDRLIHGYVVDFLDFHIGVYHWPAFNVADSAICIGVAIIIISGFFAKD
ncbi:MAG: signal peptidase II [Francisellaceae bacterium]